jgi:hypothetical protein
MAGQTAFAQTPDAGPSKEPAVAPDAGVHDEARRHLGEGNRLFRDGQYTEALREYRAAYDLVPSAKLHFNIGLSEKMLGQPVDAATELDRFLEGAGDRDPGLRADAAEYLDELTHIVATVQIKVGGNASVLVDGAPVTDPARQRPIRLAPGLHDVVVRCAGATTWQKTIDLAAGASLTLVPELSMLPQPSPGPRPAAADATPRATALVANGDIQTGRPKQARPVYRRWWFWTALAGVAGAGALAFMLHASGQGAYACGPEQNCIPLMKEQK